MDRNEAKQRLSLYRPGLDDADPAFAEALAEAERDPELAEWMRQQGETYRAVRTNLQQITPPANLRDKILRERPIPLHRGSHLAQILQLAAAITIGASAMFYWLQHQRETRGTLPVGQLVTVRGEVLDMACYVSDNLSGPEHAECARECIKKGLPVGIKTRDGQVYLLVGDSAALNDQLADYAAKIITVKGKVRRRDGFAMLDDVTIKDL